MQTVGADFAGRVDPELAPALEAMRMMGFTGGPIDLDGVPALRARLNQAWEAAVAQRPADESGPPTITTEERRVPGPRGAPEVTLRIHRPTRATVPLACVYWIHGGGMIIGSAAQDDAICTGLAEELGCVVVAVDYRLAPENPHPAPLEDCYAGLEWISVQGREIGVDRDHIVVAGGSAGGGLAAGVTLLARDRSGPAIAGQLLICPMLDDRGATPSSREFSLVPGWSREANESGWTALLGSQAASAGVSPYAAPARAQDLSGLPQAVIQVGELEVFRDEVIDYALRLFQAGVATELHVYPGVFHGADNFVPAAAVSRRMHAERTEALRALLAGRRA